jgi:hypothetical protein
MIRGTKHRVLNLYETLEAKKKLALKKAKYHFTFKNNIFLNLNTVY